MNRVDPPRPIPRATGGHRAAAWAALACLPFLIVPISQAVRAGREATGLTTYDMPYYAANARALLSRGSVGVYPNAFDPRPQAPVIYAHWLINVLALLMGPLNFDPGLALVGLQVVGGWFAARAMWALVSKLRPGSKELPWLFLSAMWGGGALVLVRVLANIATGRKLADDLLALDPGQGLWCLNFGRNLILPTETVYHALMIGLWLAVICDRWWAAGWLLWFIATTHPFSGAQALAIVAAWIAVRGLLDKRLPPTGFLVSLVVLIAVFVGYYGVFLRSFPEHREIEQTWMLGWSLSWPVMLLAYGPALALAALAIAHDAEWRLRCRFLITAAGVSFLLANHQWFITPRQPIHFTHGYIWTPLWLMGLPVIESLLGALRQRSGIVVACSRVVVLGLIVSDNATFLAVSMTPAGDHGFRMTADERAAFRTLAEHGERGVLLADDERLGYLAAVYTEARPYYGHRYNTPAFTLRRDRVHRFLFELDDADLLAQSDLFLTRSDNVVAALRRQGWTIGGRHGALTLLENPDRAAAAR